ncbi:putative Methyltransferase family protein [Hibiscus syriacus]|uniref:Methyltransferase family protein n=1 Tax=Hibiscus syriacus TaxID=106335 RepID=A0A6A2ZNZ9_HIBSY|nr:putative Methyltransferase family protein [Hibiscus syriacus]
MSSSSPHLIGVTSRQPHSPTSSRAPLEPHVSIRFNIEFEVGDEVCKSVTVTLAPNVTDAAIPTRPMPEPSSRIFSFQPLSPPLDKALTRAGEKSLRKEAANHNHCLDRTDICFCICGFAAPTPSVVSFFSPPFISQNHLTGSVPTSSSSREAILFDTVLFAPPKSQSCRPENDSRLVYKHFATLYFVFVFDSSENELAMLDVIQDASRMFVNLTLCSITASWLLPEVLNILTWNPVLLMLHSIPGWLEAASNAITLIPKSASGWLSSLLRKKETSVKSWLWGWLEEGMSHRKGGEEETGKEGVKELKKGVVVGSYRPCGLSHCLTEEMP